MKLLIIVLICVIGIYAEDSEKTYMDQALNFVIHCGSKEFTLCFKERALHYVEGLPNSLTIAGGLSIKPNNESGIDRSGRFYNIAELPEEQRAREDAIDKILADRILNYFSSHTIEFKVPDAAISEFKRSMEEGRKKKKKNNLMPLLLLVKLKMAALAGLALKALALASFKALVIAKVALTIMLIIGLKKLAEAKHHSSTYEVVAHDDHHGHYRSFGQDLAYRGHKEDFTVNENS